MLFFDPFGLTVCKAGDPLPDDALVHRIGGASPAKLSMRADEMNLSPAGISLLRMESAEAAASLAKSVAQRKKWSRMVDSTSTMGSAKVSDIRRAGFNVIHDPTTT